MRRAAALTGRAANAVRPETGPGASAAAVTARERTAGQALAGRRAACMLGEAMIGRARLGAAVGMHRRAGCSGSIYGLASWDADESSFYPNSFRVPNCLPQPLPFHTYTHAPPHSTTHTRSSTT